MALRAATSTVQVSWARLYCAGWYQGHSRVSTAVTSRPWFRLWRDSSFVCCGVDQYRQLGTFRSVQADGRETAAAEPEAWWEAGFSAVETRELREGGGQRA